ncbi:(2Fe-2S)-binding protein [Haloarcula brevis]|uniref:(2Fe-2S)-binding protein n=1 Tax=Haloarcula brevis TaxID=3111453 RepID=UPI00300F541C
MQIELDVNGETETFEASKSDSLLDVLRANGYTGAKRGCDTGACGFCTVHVDGEATLSCVTPVTKAEGASVQTIEGLGEQDDLHPVQQAFVDNTALQCGFCIPGMIMRSKALLDENPDPTEREVREALSDNLCRCTGYKKIVEAVLDAADRLDESRAVATDGGPPIDGDAPPDGAAGGTLDSGCPPGRCDCSGGET